MLAVDLGRDGRHLLLGELADHPAQRYMFW
jgi:hypothetical protein